MRGSGFVMWLGLIGCAAPSEEPPLRKPGILKGEARVPAGLAGDIWAFLYREGEGPPGTPVAPQFATAVTAGRLASGDAHFVFGQVAPNPYRLWAFLDLDSNFDPTVDVLAQPGASDRLGSGVELNLQPGATVTQDVSLEQLVLHEPPGFRLEGDELDVVLDGTLDNPKAVTLVTDAAGRLDAQRTAFYFGLVDRDGDRTPDDGDADGVPDLSLQVFLRWKPRPGEDGGGGSVVVPLVFNPAPFLSELGGRLDLEVAVTRIQGAVIPQAQRVIPLPGRLPQVTSVGAPPRGDYELVALTGQGQFWRLPNDLAKDQPAQGPRFHFDRSGR